LLSFPIGVVNTKNVAVRPKRRTPVEIRQWVSRDRPRDGRTESHGR
jgi:hypothetical protein